MTNAEMYLQGAPVDPDNVKQLCLMILLLTKALMPSLAAIEWQTGTSRPTLRQ